MEIVTIDVSRHEVLKQLTLEVQVTGFKGWGIRVWLGTGLIKLGAAIIGCKTTVEVK